MFYSFVLRKIKVSISIRNSARAPPWTSAFRPHTAKGFRKISLRDGREFNLNLQIKLKKQAKKQAKKQPHGPEKTQAEKKQAASGFDFEGKGKGLSIMWAGVLAGDGGLLDGDVRC